MPGRPASPSTFERCKLDFNEREHNQRSYICIGTFSLRAKIRLQCPNSGVWMGVLLKSACCCAFS